ncbi:hypothetical protein [Cohnella lupini]|uniref:Uncharacterized protein n=1 Tax=Cohnella lupini TaxID=1294267 RepID=A0A3D9INF5_9BACL|nr:hypothetical protein [Cohnella lupini]RED63251.1 hypothetical protein DFP95_104245 [Cohnella lupini]
MPMSEANPYWDTVLRVAPLLYMDRLEPFKPIRVGVTVFEASAPSLSFDRNIIVQRDTIRMVIEYAIYWDYDIQHVYDLEHVWIYVDHDGEIASCEVSFHGRYLIGLLRDRSNLSADKRVRLFVQPGKHAMSPLEEVFRLLPNVESCCQEEAGVDGVLEPSMFKGQFKSGDDIDDRAETLLRSFSFQPTFDYVPHKWASDDFVSWDELRVEIPVRMRAVVASLA